MIDYLGERKAAAGLLDFPRQYKPGRVHTCAWVRPFKAAMRIIALNHLAIIMSISGQNVAWFLFELKIDQRNSSR